MQKWFYRWIECKRKRARDFCNVSRWAHRKLYKVTVFELRKTQWTNTQKWEIALYSLYIAWKDCYKIVYKGKINLKRENKVKLYMLSCLNFTLKALGRHSRILSREMSWSNLLFRKVILELVWKTDYTGATWERKLFLMNPHEKWWESEL